MSADTGSSVGFDQNNSNTPLYRTLICNGFYIKCHENDPPSLKNALYREFGYEELSEMLLVDSKGIVVSTPNSLHCFNSEAPGIDPEDEERGYCVWDDVNKLDGYEVENSRVVENKHSELLNKVKLHAESLGLDCSDIAWWVIEYRWTPKLTQISEETTFLEVENLTYSRKYRIKYQLEKYDIKSVINYIIDCKTRS